MNGAWYFFLFRRQMVPGRGEAWAEWNAEKALLPAAPVPSAQFAASDLPELIELIVDLVQPSSRRAAIIEASKGAEELAAFVRQMFNLGQHHRPHADRLKLANRLHFIDHPHDLHDHGAPTGAPTAHNSRRSGSIAFRKELTSDSSNCCATGCTDSSGPCFGRAIIARRNGFSRCVHPPKAMARTPRMIMAEAAIWRERSRSCSTKTPRSIPKKMLISRSGTT